MKAFLFGILILTSLLIVVDSQADTTPAKDAVRLVEISDVYGRNVSDAQLSTFGTSVQNAIQQLKTVKFALMTATADGIDTYDFQDEKNKSVFMLSGETLVSSHAAFPATSFEIEVVDDSQTLVHVHFGEANKQIIASLSLTPKAH